MQKQFFIDIDVESYKLLIILRNSWFHGVMLDENNNCDNENSLLSFEFVMNSLVTIKATLKRNENKYHNSIVTRIIFEFYE